MKLHALAAGTVLALLAPALSACTSNSSAEGGGDDRTVTVTSSDENCELSSTEVPAGPLTFEVSNSGSKVTEFYLLGEDGQRIVGEVENIGPNLDRDLVVTVPKGDYVTACKPGMKGEGIRADFTVEPSEDGKVDAGDSATIKQAEGNYATYVTDQSDQLLQKTEKFAALYTSGKDEKARDLYPRAREHWERIETVAESFGDLDPKMDAREADLEEDQKWTGWHRIEKDLWPPEGTKYTPLTKKERAEHAEDLLENTRTLDRRVQKMDFTIDQISNGSIGLLEEVANGTITGEEEIWSHTDLYDFQANVDGARVAYEGVRPILLTKDKALAKELDKRFEELQASLDEHRDGKDGFVSYTDLSDKEVKELSDRVGALSEPLSRLTGEIV